MIRHSGFPSPSYPNTYCTPGRNNALESLIEERKVNIQEEKNGTYKLSGAVYCCAEGVTSGEGKKNQSRLDKY